MKTTITVDDTTRSKLMKYKYELGCANIDELLNKILEIVDAREYALKRGKKI